MTRRKRIFLVAGALAVLALAVLYASLPKLVGRAILFQAGRLGLKDPHLRVTHVGLGRLDLAGFRVGAAAAPALSIERVTVSYSPLGLLRKRIDGISLSGIEVRIENRGEGFRFPGWSGVAEASGESGAAIAIGRIELDKGRLLLLLGERELEIPFSARLRAHGSGYALEAGLRPLGEAVRLQGTLDKEFTTGTIAFTVQGADLAALLGPDALGAPVSARGRVSVEGEVRLRQGGFAGGAVQADSAGGLELAVPGQAGLALESLRLACRLNPGLELGEITASARVTRFEAKGLEVPSPFRLDLISRRWPEMEFDVSGLHVGRPIPVVCERISAKLVPPLETARLSGDFRMQAGSGLLAALASGPWALRRPYALSGSFQAGRSDGEVTWSLKAGGDGVLSLSAGRDSARGNLKLDASLNGDGRGGRAVVSGRLAHAELRLADARAGAGELGGSADLAFAFSGDWSARGILRVRDGQVLAAGSDGLQASGVSVSLPWRYPGAGPGKIGSFSIARLQGGGLRAQDIHGTLGQEGRGLAFSGRAHSGLPEVSLSFQGRFEPLAGGPQVQARFQVPATVLPAETPLRKLHPRLQGMEFGGGLAAQGSAWGAGGRYGASAAFEIADGEFRHEGEAVVLRGVQARIRLDSLLDLATPPAQRIRFKELRWQGNILSNGELAFQGAGNGGLAIESGRFEWNGGTVTLGPLRLEPGGDAPQVTLHCENVDLARMLNALAGSEIVSGDARLSGIIPVKLVGGSPVFSGGYLDSAPGQGGRLRVSKPEAVSGGQVLVEEAIRDFHYNWIKVRLDSRNDRLNMVVSIDGAPARKLPLRYDQKKKDFIRDPAGQRHVELKGLLLDIRFNDIDLKDLLEAGGQVTAGQNDK